MRNRKSLIIQQLDQKLSPLKELENLIAPSKGWINAIRTSLNMTMSQLGVKLNITRQGVKNLEDSEAKGSISLKSLREVGQAMDLKLVYGFVPIDQSLDQLIKRKSQALAKKIVLRTDQTMILEDQGMDKSLVQQSIDELAEELQRELSKSLWD